MLMLIKDYKMNPNDEKLSYSLKNITRKSEELFNQMLLLIHRLWIINMKLNKI